MPPSYAGAVKLTVAVDDDVAVAVPIIGASGGPGNTAGGVKTNPLLKVTPVPIIIFYFVAIVKVRPASIDVKPDPTKVGELWLLVLFRPN